MRFLYRFMIPLLVFTLACRAVIPVETPAALEAPLRTPAATTVQPTATSSPPAPQATPTDPSRPADPAYTVRTHPDGPLYVGDQISLEVIPAEGVDVGGRKIQVQTAQGETIGTAEFGQHGIGGRLQATLEWIWDTSVLPPGEQTLSFEIGPDGPTWTETFTLHPQGEVPPPEPGARWAQAESECCLVYYITGTEAERDLDSILDLIDEQAGRAAQALGVNEAEGNGPIEITLLPRVLGHGGFASDEIAVSYLDRNYIGTSPALILHHELVHLLDGRLGGKGQPTLLVEGLAVYLSGGHFKPEPLLARAAALQPPSAGCAPVVFAPAGPAWSAEPCGLNRYIPLKSLLEDFYFSQHEIGYLQAAALIDFMVETWGWERFEAFYRDFPSQSEGGQDGGIEAALDEHYNLSLMELEDRFQEALEREPLSPELVTDVRLTVEFFDTVRRYQRLLDPSAYFLTAWLPDADEMRARGIVADYLRRPPNPENVALEGLLSAAGEALRQGNYPRTEKLLQAVNRALDVFESGGTVF